MVGGRRSRGAVSYGEAPMRRSMMLTLSTHFTAFAMLPSALTLAPSVLGTGIAEARTISQCFSRHRACGDRCLNKAGFDVPMEKIKAGSKEQKALAACNARTCDPQFNSCVANASDSKKPTSASNPGSPVTSTPTRSGLLETTPGLTPTGPAATGSPAGAPSSGAPTAGPLR